LSFLYPFHYHLHLIPKIKKNSPQTPFFTLFKAISFIHVYLSHHHQPHQS
jgi:hypothetical protein